MKYHCNKCCKTLYEDDLASDECRFCGEPYFEGAFMEKEVKEISDCVNKMISWLSIKQEAYKNNNYCPNFLIENHLHDLMTIKKLIKSLTGV